METINETGEMEAEVREELGDVAGMALGLLCGAMQREDAPAELEGLVDKMASLLDPISRVAGGRCGSWECEAALRLALEVEAGNENGLSASDAIKRSRVLFDVIFRCSNDLWRERAADVPDERTVAGAAISMCIASMLLAYLGLAAENPGLACLVLRNVLDELSTIIRCCDRLMLEYPGSGWGVLSAELICSGMKGE